MPASLFSWYGTLELKGLGERRSVLRGEIELKRFNRLADLLESDAGVVTAALSFRKEAGGWLIVELEYEATVHLLCQRCLTPLEHHVKDKVEMALLESASLEQHVPDRYEPVVLEEDRLMPAMLIEDELIISLPIVPRHERPEECDPPSAGITRDDRG
ncbi:MAG TPA: YceD family protein [Gammaproteobacteria bacterium]